MKKELKIPNLGENIASAEVLKILVKVGDKVEKEQSVLEISSDKATLEVPADIGGVVKEISINEGDSVSEGQTIFILEDETSSEEAPATEQATTEEKSEKATQENNSEPEEEQAPTENTETESSEQSSAKAQFLLPNLGENIAAAEVLKILVKVGDKIEKDQSVLEISSDKATLEVPSDVSGTIKSISIQEGDSVKEGDLILELEGSSGQVKSEAPKSEPAKTEKSPVVSQAVKVNQDQVRQEIKDKQTEASEITTQALSQNNVARSKDVAPAAPSVRRFAREIGIDINSVKGTGEAGRISLEDVKTYSKEVNKSRSANVAVSSGPSVSGYKENLPDFSKWGEVSKEPMNNVRFKTAQHLTYAWNTIPHVTHFEKIDITDLEKLRKNYAKKVEAAGGKLTMTSILLKIVSSALKVFPKFASSIDLDNKEIIYKNYIHLGLAVDTDRGLLVPVIRDTDKKNITQISIEVGQMAQKARDKKLSLDDMQGAVFTISNLGGIGGVGFTPVVNSPEVAILGVSQSNYEPVYINGVFEPKLIMPLSLSYDHRVIDGADAARFMKWLKEAIENPFLLILEG